MEGWVSIHRQIMDHWIYKDAEYLKTWLEMLLRARFSKEPGNEMIDGEMVTVSHGQFIFGRVKWSERLGIGEQRLRTLLKKLQGEGMIELVSTHRKCTIYRICNYENFQNIVFKEESSSKSLTKSDVSFFNHEDNHQIYQAHQEVAASFNHDTNQQLTISQPSPNHQLTTKEQSNKDNKEINNQEEDKAMTVMDAYFYSFKKWNMTGPITDYVTKLRKRGCTEQFIVEVILLMGEKGTNADLKYMTAVTEDWISKGINSREEALAHFQKLHPKVTHIQGKQQYNGGQARKPHIEGLRPPTDSARLSDEELAAARAMAAKLDERFRTNKEA